MTDEDRLATLEQAALTQAGPELGSVSMVRLPRLSDAVHDAGRLVELLPDDTGLMIADQYGADLVREAPVTPLAGARRKGVTLRFPRAAAWRLQALADPNAMGVESLG